MQVTAKINTDFRFANMKLIDLSEIKRISVAINLSLVISLVTLYLMIIY